MSTVNPDERERAIARLLRPAVFVAVILVQFLAPVLALLWFLRIIPADGGYILVHVLIWVAVGLTAMFALPGSRNPYLIASFILAYVGGLFLTILMIDSPEDVHDPVSLVMIAAPYVVAVVVFGLYHLRARAIRRTQAGGVDTTGTIISAPVSGMVNYVQRQRLTIRFTDQEGTERFVRIGRTGGGYSAGDTVQVRYDPTRPWSKRGILIDGDGPSIF